MNDYYTFLRPLLFTLPPEKAHKVAVAALTRGIIPPLPHAQDDRLSLCVAGLAFRNPVGVAAGFDKNAQAFGELYRHGAGLVEVGTVTPQPQQGNPKPRMFRCVADKAVINRLGFNNDGAENALTQVMQQSSRRTGMLGINIGKNKETEDALADYVLLLDYMYDAADYITVNISSPNTAGLRELQKAEYFDDFVRAIMQERNGIAAYKGFRRPVLFKIAPDIDIEALQRMLDTLMHHRADGVIISNTTIMRPDTLSGEHAVQTGGLSGAPLTRRACDLVRAAYRHTEGNLPIIGVGGIMNGADAVARIRAGASLIQCYTGIIYRGLGLLGECSHALIDELDRCALDRVEQLIGLDS